MDSAVTLTGAAGFAGSHLLDRLLDPLGARTPVTAWYRPNRSSATRRAGPDWQPVDLLDRAAVARAMARARPSRIYHLAGAARADTAWQNVVPHLEANVLGTHYLLDAVRQMNAPCRVLVVTSAAIYEPASVIIDEDGPLVPASPYGLSKLAQDELARRAVADGLDVAIARPFNHAGPGQDPAYVVSSFARQIALIEAGRLPAELHVGNLDARRDLTDVRDVVDAYERIMLNAPSGRLYNIASGQAVRIGDLLDRLLALSRAPVRVTVDPARLRPEDMPVLVGDSTRIRTELGWTPGISLERLLADTLEWWRSAIGATR
jgi:GDP-4-dehydro-6-deoxy-D-mannose reductase